MYKSIRTIGVAFNAPCSTILLEQKSGPFAMKRMLDSMAMCAVFLGVLITSAKCQSQILGLSKTDRVAINKPDVEKAYTDGINILIRGAENYPRNRDCFSCHHQAMSVFAISPSLRSAEELARKSEAHLRYLEVNKAVREFTLQSFESMKPQLVAGKKIGGRTLTTGYALWALDIMGHEPDETTNALVENLLLTQEEDGHWGIDSLRPPASSSLHMATAFALLGLDLYGNSQQDKTRINKARDRAKAWHKNNPAEGSTEDLVGSLWCSYLFSPHTANDSSQAIKLIDLQREDGGWAQEIGMESDAYATGQVLIMWANVRNAYRKLPAFYSDERFRRGIKFLLEHQKPDGSWHVASRARPVQEFFDNEDPHGKDQFISYMATGWATAALGVYLYRDTKLGPLQSQRVASATNQVGPPEGLFGVEADAPNR